MDHFSFNITEYLLFLVYAFLGYKVANVIYRLYFSPLAGFPGPRLAAATSLYEFYFDVLQGGQFMFHLDHLHAKYGPIVRINPRELHIKDPSFYDTLYGGPLNKRDRDPPFIQTGMPLSTFETAPSGLHRERRKLLSPFLSTQAVTGLQSVVREKVDLICGHMSRRVGTGEFMDMHALSASFAADVMSSYVFGPENCYGYLNNAEISTEWKKNINSIFEGLLFLRHLPYTLDPARVFPNFTSWLFPTYEFIHRMEKVCAIIVWHGNVLTNA
jgi:hypothetical protein